MCCGWKEKEYLKEYWSGNQQVGETEEEQGKDGVGIRGWKNLCKERVEWKKITEKAKTHSGL